MGTTTTTDARTVQVLYLAETITTDDLGETVEGDHGLMVDGETFVSFDGITGARAAALLDAHRAPMALRDALGELDDLGAIDYLDVRGGELIAYAADLPRVDDDEPYVRAIAVTGHPRAIRALADAIS